MLLDCEWPEVKYRVGVHVRRTDLGIETGKATAENFALRDRGLQQRMDQLVAEDGNVVFVVGSDNPESLAWLQRRYGELILHTGSHWGRFGQRCTAMEDVAADLYALAACRQILGTTTSTFSTMASWLGGAPLETQ